MKVIKDRMNELGWSTYILSKKANIYFVAAKNVVNGIPVKTEILKKVFDALGIEYYKFMK